jgi:hypothetical protein
MLRRQKLKPALSHLALYAAMLVVLAVTVSGCSISSKPEPIVITKVLSPALPAAAKQPCEKPVRLPDKDLSEREATGYWARDRANLTACETRRSAAVLAQANPTPTDPLKAPK